MSQNDRTYSTDVDSRLEFINKQVYRLLTADIVCVFSEYRGVRGLQLASIQQSEAISTEMWETFAFWLDKQLSGLDTQRTPQVVLLEDEKVLLKGQVLIWPLISVEHVIGVVVAYSTGEITTESLHQIEAPVGLLHSFLENQHLTERLITTEAIAQTARAIAHNPSPQNIVHILRDYLFDAHITTCAFAVFGPVQPDHPHMPFEYLEVQGSWSRQMGSEIGLGKRYVIKENAPYLRALEREKLLIFQNLQSTDNNDFDEFSRMVLHADQIETLALILLQTNTRHLGVIAIASDHPHEFSPHELRSYQIVAEFLTMSTMAGALRQQADFVQRGRAALLDAVTDGVVMVLPGEDATVLTVNQQFTVLFGLTESEVQGISLWELLDRMPIPASVRRDLRKRWQREDTESRFRGSNEFNMTLANGAEHDIEWYSAPVYQDAQVMGYIYTFHDITSERIAERLRTQLISRISHELRTPLTSIRGFAEFILEMEGENLPETAREYTEIIHKSAIHLNHLFTDLIELTRANVGEVKLNRSPVNMSRVVSDVIARLQPHFEERHMQIAAEIDENLPDTLIDKDRIDQVLANLLSNAIKYSREESGILVKVQYVGCDTQLPESSPQGVTIPSLLVSVVDEGKGLSVEEATRIFLPFYRTKDANAGKIEGTGLGLAISHSIIQLHEGRIWVEPSTRKSPGGRFFFTIPVAEPT